MKSKIIYFLFLFFPVLIMSAFFDAQKEEYCPIPLKQINFSQGVYKQNPGY